MFSCSMKLKLIKQFANDDEILKFIILSTLNDDVEHNHCKINIIDFVDETLTNISEMKNVKCNNIYLNVLKLKIDFRKIRRHFVT